MIAPLLFLCQGRGLHRIPQQLTQKPYSAALLPNSIGDWMPTERGLAWGLGQVD
jgi:hypothetical protein